MKKNWLVFGVCLVAMGILMPSEMLATTTSSGGIVIAGFQEKTIEVQNFLFGIPMRLAATFAFVLGALQSWFSTNYTGLYSCIGLSLIYNFIPTFLHGIFASTMLLP